MLNRDVCRTSLWQGRQLVDDAVIYTIAIPCTLLLNMARTVNNRLSHMPLKLHFPLPCMLRHKTRAGSNVHWSQRCTPGFFYVIVGLFEEVREQNKSFRRHVKFPSLCMLILNHLNRSVHYRLLRALHILVQHIRMLLFLRNRELSISSCKNVE